MNDKVRCGWAVSDPFNLEYHDKEWGVPVHDDRKLFEFLILEGAQAGLSWTTILKKREGYRKAFDKFDFAKISKYEDRKVQSLLLDAGIIRNRLKIAATIQNSKSILLVQKEFGSFDKYIWGFVNYKTIKNHIKDMGDYPTTSDGAKEMSKDLLKRGFKFVGPTICYAFMEAVGMINDHQMNCFRYNEV